ncbi:hypothetical protein HY837_02780 [archaeon]|nr:hypothetical protein [archaeon]
MNLEEQLNNQVKKSAFRQVKELPGKLKESITGNSQEGKKVLPLVAVCTGASWFLGVGTLLARSWGLNIGYNLAAGAGLAGGFVDNRAQKLMTGAALAVSIAPDLIYTIASERSSVSEMIVKGAAYAACYAGSNYLRNKWNGK